MIRRRRFRCAAAAVAALILALAVNLLLPAGARAADNSPTLTRIKQKGVITLAYRDDARPFSSRGPDGLPVGYSIDLCKQVADEVRRETGLEKLRVDWIPVDAKSRFTVTEHGLADMVCGTTSMTLSRMNRVDFSLVTFVTGSSLLVPNTMVPDLRRIGTATIGVLAGTTSEQGLKAYIKKNNLPIAVAARAQSGNRAAPRSTGARSRATCPTSFCSRTSRTGPPSAASTGSAASSCLTTRTG